MYKIHSVCRACGSLALNEVFSFGKPMPLANDFTLPDQERQGFVPVRIMRCSGCGLAQLGETVDPAILYKNYLYVTSSSKTMERHFDRLVKDMASENGIGSLVEVGANDGLFIQYAKRRGFGPVAGIDPAANLAGARGQGAIMITEFFSVGSASIALSKLSKVDTILARHCFCHQEWYPFMDAVAEMSNPKTLVCIEVPYVKDMLARTEFDSIYSEHTSYMSLKAMAALLKSTEFHLHAVVRYGIHGGALLVMLRHNDSEIEPHLSAEEYLSEENITDDDWLNFSCRALLKTNRIREAVRQARSEGKIVSAFGASAKASVLINACGFTKKDIAFVTDNSPLKPGRLISGTDIPIIEEAQMLAEHPDYSLLSAWNFKAEILSKCQKWRDRGGRFIVPTAEGVEIV
jgi:hypothetical protein